MEQMNNNIKCCATCAYWLGSRAPNRLGFVEVRSKMDTSKCGKKALTESRTYQAGYSCNAYVKWQVLR